jgi:putative transposase
MKYTYMNERLKQYSMAAWCQGLQVSSSGFYAWRKRIKEPCAVDGSLQEAYAAHKGKAGAPSLCADLRAQGFRISVRTVGRKLKACGLRGKVTRKFRHTTDSKHNLLVAPNRLNRQFKVGRPNQVWVGDITYLRTNEGWLYLAVVIDLFNRQVVGWQMSTRIDQALVNDALMAALIMRGMPKGVMIHTDQGSQYCAKSFRRILKQNKLTRSQSRKGNCWDNAVAESFFASLKKQSVYGYALTNRDQMRQRIFEYIEVYYNRVRRHSANGWLSPSQFERLHYQTLEGLAVH